MPPSATPGPAVRLRGALPLFGGGAVCVAVAGYLGAAGARFGPSALPDWVLFAGMAGIAFAGGAVALFVRAPTRLAPAPTEPGPSAPPRPWDEGPGPEAPVPVDAAAAIPEPPRPDVAVPSSFGARADEARSVNAVLAELPSALRRAPVPRSADRPAVGAAREAPGPLSCASCGRALAARDGWRRCRRCDRTLCAECFTGSIRAHGAGYCPACAPAAA